jgi:dTDP-4-amino-4,6-dideoxygalactose transaminase
MSIPKSGVPLLDLATPHREMREELLQSLSSVLDDGRFLFGPDVTALEQEIARISQVEHAIGCANGSDALLLALMALGIGPGDEVIAPSFTFFATVSCISRLGATPVLVDILPDTFNIDPQAIEANITAKTKAIIPVHLFGQCAAIDAICAIGERHKIPVVEDAAQAIAAAYHGKAAGSWGAIGCLSFYPTKNLGGMGDGGMLTTNDPAIADRLRLLAGHGMRPRYYHSLIGINSRLDSFQAAVLRVKFKRLAEMTAQRQQAASRYHELFTRAGLDEVLVLPKQDPAAYHVWNQYGIRVLQGARDELREHLRARGIGTEIYYPIPLHQQVCFQGTPLRFDRMVETIRATQEVLHLPIYPGIPETDQFQVVEGIRNYFAASVRRAA